jgi:hypothetical protein
MCARVCDVGQVKCARGFCVRESVMRGARRVWVRGVCAWQVKCARGFCVRESVMRGARRVWVRGVCAWLLCAWECDAGWGRPA